jgi:translation initiation factor IF-2
MTKLRVYELARELNVEAKLLLARLKSGGAKVLTHQSTLTDQQVADLRSAFGQSAVAAAASGGGGAAAASSGPKVVIRRRAPTPAGGEEATAQAATETPQVVAPSIPTSATVAPTGAEAEEEPAAPVVAAPAAAIQEPEAPAAVAAVAAPEVEPVAPVAPSAPVAPAATAETAAPAAPATNVATAPQRPATIPTPPPGSVPRSTTGGAVVRPAATVAGASAVSRAPAGSEVSGRRPDDRTPERNAPSAAGPVAAGPAGATAGPATGPSGGIIRRRESAGATIVRRATPEEIEQAKQRQQAGRKEDARGTRVTGMGLLNRSGPEPGVSRGGPPGAGGAPGAPGGSDTETDQWGRRGAPGSRERKNYDEEEAAKKKAAAAKGGKRSGAVNMRTLLNEVDLGDSGPEEEVAAAPVPSAPSASSYPARTVYTPSGARTKRDLKRRKDLKKTQITTPRASYRVVEMGESITVGELAKAMAVKASDLIKKLMTQGVMATINQVIDLDTATLLAGEYQFEVKSVVTTVEDVIRRDVKAEGDLESRPPIVTIMGHVDHGKTSILDAIRSADVAAGEAGGITQHIGAYAVERNGKKITFLDTPGHEAFSAMRARGAKVTDIVILVVAADDGVMPQTIEAISHAKAANVPLIVAVNKMDKPNINLDRVYTELTEHGVQAEEWGGDTQFVKVSALKRTGLDELLEAILLQSEVLDLKATREGQAEGSVVEAHLDKGRGPVATMIVQAGTLRVGDYVVAGTEYGRVRAMHDHNAKDLPEAGPAIPVEIIGLSGVPMAGDKFNVVVDEKTAREASGMRLEAARRAAAAKSSAASLEDLLSKVKSAAIPEVPMIVKADTQGSVEAISESLLKLSTPKVRNRVVHAAVGGVTESDVTLAAATGAIVIGFNVRATRGLDDTAEKAGVMIRYFSIIYEIVDTVKAIMVGKLPPIVKEVVLGRAEVRKPISVPKIGTIGGSAVIDGKVTRQSLVRLIRNEIVIYTGKIGSLRRFKDDVKEVAQGYECGIGIEGYNDLREGDQIEAYVLEESAPTL